MPPNSRSTSNPPRRPGRLPPVDQHLAVSPGFQSAKHPPLAHKPTSGDRCASTNAPRPTLQDQCPPQTQNAQGQMPQVQQRTPFPTGRGVPGLRPQFAVRSSVTSPDVSQNFVTKINPRENCATRNQNRERDLHPPTDRAVWAKVHTAGEKCSLPGRYGGNRFRSMSADKQGSHRTRHESSQSGLPVP